MSDDGNLILRWDRWDLHEKTRTTTLKSLWKNEDFLDVTIACDDEQIEAHKVILSAASPFFQKILKRNPHSHPLIYLRGTAKKDVQALLDFIYSGETHVLQEELEDFMDLACSLQVKGLVGELSGKKKGKYDESVKKIEENKTTSRNKQTTRNMEFLVEEDIENAERNDSKYDESEFGSLEEKKNKARNKPSFRKKEMLLKEDIQIVELEEINSMENDISDIMGKYGISEETGVFLNIQNAERKDKQYDESSENLEEKKNKATNIPSFRKKEDVQIVELEEISLMENDISDIMENYDSSEEKDSFQYQNTSNNASMTEYDEKILEVVAKLEVGWTCTICPYTTKMKGHVLEHAEKHVEGYSHECKYCEKSYSQKRGLRSHERRCNQLDHE